LVYLRPRIFADEEVIGVILGVKPLRAVHSLSRPSGLFGLKDVVEPPFHPLQPAAAEAMADRQAATEDRRMGFRLRFMKLRRTPAYAVGYGVARVGAPRGVKESIWFVWFLWFLGLPLGA